MAVVINVVGNYDGRQLAKAERDLASLRKQAEATGSGVQTAFSKQAAAFKTFGSRVSTTGRAMSDFGSSMTRNVTMPLAAVGAVAYKAIQSASDFAETQSKVGVIFGDQAKQIEAWSKTMATSFGQSETEAMNAASTFAMFGSSAGLSGENLVGFSTELTQLASDMASFNNTSPEQAITAIGAALRGEMEPIRKYNVLLNDAALKQEYYEMTGKKVTGTLTAQQKVLASSSLIFKQTTKQQGDFARTSDGLANQQRILQAELKNTTKDVGMALLPVALQLVTVIRDEVVPIITSFSNWMKTLSPQTIEWAVKIGMVVAAVGPLILVVGKLTTAIGSTITGIGSLISVTGKGVTALTAFGQGFVKPASGMSAFAGKAQRAGALVSTAIIKMAGAVKMAMTAIFTVLKNNPWILVAMAVAAAVILIIKNWDKVKAFVIGAWNAIKDAASKVWNAIVDTVKKAGELIWRAIQSYFDFYRKMGEFGLRLVQGLWNGINDAVGWIIEKIKGFGLSILDGIKSIFGIASPSKETTKIGKYLTEGLANGMTDPDATGKVKNAAKKVGKTTKDALKSAMSDLKDVSQGIKDAIAGALDSVRDQITAVSDEIYEALEATLTATEDMVASAQDKVDDMSGTFEDLRREARDFSNQIRDSIRSFFSLADAANPDSGKGLIENLRDQVQQATAFSQQVKQLRALGLNQSSLDEIIGAGVAQGSKIAAAVLSGGSSAISEINSLESKLREEASNLGDLFAEDRFGAELAKSRANLDYAVQSLNAATRSRDAIVTQITEFRKRTDAILGRSTSALKTAVEEMQKAIGPQGLVGAVSGIMAVINNAILSLASMKVVEKTLEGTGDTLGMADPKFATKVEEVTPSIVVAPGAVQITATTTQTPEQIATQVTSALTTALRKAAELY